jgi:hypothetical protein
MQSRLTFNIAAVVIVAIIGYLFKPEVAGIGVAVASITVMIFNPEIKTETVEVKTEVQVEKKRRGKSNLFKLLTETIVMIKNIQPDIHIGYRIDKDEQTMRVGRSLIIDNQQQFITYFIIDRKNKILDLKDVEEEYIEDSYHQQFQPTHYTN